MSVDLIEENYEIIQNEVLEGKEILKVKDDRTFRLLFNTRDKKAIWWFMAQILERKMEDIKDIITVENYALPPLNRYDKGKNLDFIVNVGNDVILVEMNNNNKGKDYTRNLLYTFHALLNKVMIGEKYPKLHAVLVNLNWFDEKEKKLKEMDGIQIVKYPYPIIGEEYTDSIIIVKNINLAFYEKQEYNGVKMKDFLWKLFTIDKLDDIRDIGKNIKELRDYCREIERLSKSKEYCMVVWNDKLEENLQNMAAYNDGKKEGIQQGKKEGRIEGIKQGREEGKVEGKIENQREMIINMYKKKISIEDISDCANITKEEVEEILNNYQNIQ